MSLTDSNTNNLPDSLFFSDQDRLVVSIVDYEKELVAKRYQLLTTLKNPVIYREFIDFMSYSKSTRFLFVLNLIYTFLFIPPFLEAFIRDESAEEGSSLSFSIPEGFLLVCIIVLGWLLLLLIVYEKKMQNQRLCVYFYKRYKSICDGIQAALYILLLCFHGSLLIFRTAIGPCKSKFRENISSWRCNPNAEGGALPLDSVIMVMFIPIIFTCVLRETRIILTIVGWALAVMSLIISAVVLGSMKPTLSITFYLMTSVVIMFDSFKQYLLLFLLSRKLKGLLEMNEKLADQNKANEMRNMIANVAHDLKTPLSSFMTGIELMHRDIVECQEKVQAGNEDFQQTVLVMIHELHQCVGNIRNTNSFMLMTINRCLDYAKATSGLKLLPKYETVELQETLALPLNCMINIQQKVQIVCEQFGQFATSDICTHIITDKQWLQENLLCLLSNAVKYSSAGEVKIRISKMQQSALKKTPGKIMDEPIIQELPLKVRAKKLADLFEMIPSPPVTFPTSAFDEEEQDGCRDGLPDEDSSSSDSSQKPLVSNLHGEEIQDVLLFEVQDSGIGLRDEDMPGLFNPFKQTQRLAGGTGLGLYSFAKRIEALRGQYGVHKREDGVQGSIFWFTIPYRPDILCSSLAARPNLTKVESTSKEDIAKFGQSNSSLPIREAEPSNGLWILVAEDTPSIAKMTTMILKRQGHKVEIAENGQLVVDLFNKRDHMTGKCKFDVILMDLQMPVMDGLEATRRIREIERRCSCDCTSSSISASAMFPHHQLIIGVSANSDHETMEEAVDAGIDEFLPKPFTIQAFTAIVNKCLESKPV